MVSPFAATGFAQGFTQTALPLMRLQLARQQFEAQQETAREKLKLLKKRIEGEEADFRLREDQAKAKLLQLHQQQRGRQEAGAAGAALLDQSLPLDEQSRGELQGIIARQQASEGEFTGMQKLLAARDDVKRRQSLAESLGSVLEDLPAAHQAFGKGALQSFVQGGLDDTGLFRALDRITGLTGMPQSRLQLAFLASGTGPRAEQAKKALALLPEEMARITTAELSLLAEQEGPQAEAAKRALATLKDLRGTGVRKGQRRGAGRRGGFAGQEAEQVPSVTPQPPLRELPGGGVQGQGRFAPGEPLPKVKRFRRIR